MFYSRRLAAVFALCAFLAFTGCASIPQTPAEKAEAKATNDPFESVNRVTFDVNDFLDRLLIRPLAELYRYTVPPPVRDRISGIVKNMSEPVVFANNLLQGEGTKAGKTLGRFLANTTLGVGGMFEVANSFGLQQQSGDFGQTLYVWGFGSGPYIVLPLFGPSNVRDAIGLGVDSVASPWKYLAAMGGNGTYNRFMASDLVAGALVKREENIEGLDALREGSLDFYAQMRSVYRQHRAKELGATLPGETPVFEDYELEQQTSPVIQ
jgi:phospholipid-binding lipoprotein MlaA